MTIIIFIGLAGALQANAQGMEFFKGTWEEALEESKKQGKPIFVDAYTAWCGPCKKMAAVVFPNPEVGAFYNKFFINVKMDMEKGEGPDFAQKYEVRSFPTLLYIDSKGELIHKAVGMRQPAQFIAEGKKGMYDEGHLEDLAAEYKEGKRDPEFLRKYISLLYVAQAPAYQRVAFEFLKSLDEITIKEKANMDLIYGQADRISGKPFKMMMKHRALFDEVYGVEDVQDRILKTAMSSVKEAVADKDEELFNDVIDVLKGFGEEAEIDIYLASLEYYRGTEDWAAYQTTAIEFLDAYDVEDEKLLNTIAWDFYKNVEETAALEKAETWARTSVQIKSAYHNNDTLAAILYKLGKLSEAIEVAEKAIAIAKIEKKDPKSTKRLLDKIFSD